MRLTCASCGAVHSAESWQTDPCARRALALAAGLPKPVGDQVFEYLGLFRKPDAKTGMAWSKAERLLRELNSLITCGHVQYKGRPARSANADIWRRAMETMTGARWKLKLPMENHNYLISIAYDLADETDRRAETARNKAERAGTLVDKQNRDRECRPFGGMSPEEMRAIRKKKEQERKAKHVE